MIFLTKIDAVKRQLETAVKLYFQNEDIVSIHTIVSACRILLKDLLPKIKGIDSEFEATVTSKFPQEYHKLLRNSYNKQQNFLKHADSDSAETLEFNALITEMFIYIAINDLQKLVGDITLLQFAFRAWFIVRNAEKFGLKKELFEDYRNLNRKDFLEMFSKDVILYNLFGTFRQ